MAHLVDIFLQPSKVFAELKEKPTFLIPLLIVAALTVALTLLYFTTVDSAWYLDHTLMASGDDMSAAELAQAKQLMPGTRTMGFIGAPVAAIGMALISVLYAAYFMLAGRITGIDVSFRRGLSLICWASMPMVLGLIGTIASAVTMSPQTALESLMLTNVDPLLVQLPMDSAWSGLAKGFNLLNLWVWFLLALGWRTWSKSSWVQAAIVALLPSLVFYGGMTTFAMLK
jgi:hypothetical protein